jgi:hypothetical protein
MVVATMIGELYNQLYESCKCKSVVLYEGQSREDVFQETILFAIHDKNAPHDRNLFIRYFQYKFNMILFQTIKDYHQQVILHYADNIQTKKEKEQ